VKNLCGLFVRIIDSKVYLVHQTAREFLIKGSLPGYGNWQYTLCPIDSSFILADICISYLSLQEFETDPLAMDPVGIPGRVPTQNYVQKYGLIAYAASHWADHCRDSKNRQMELFEFTTLICKPGSNRFLTWLRLYWESSAGREHYIFPHDLTHLMVASWFGQQAIVKRLLEQRESINARSGIYGTALNVAALRGEEDICEMLVKGGVNAYLNGKEYNILLTWKSELTRRGHFYVRLGDGVYYGNYVYFRSTVVIRPLLPLCPRGIRDLPTFLCRFISPRP